MTAPEERSTRSPWPEGEPWVGSDLGLLEGLATTRAIRRFRPDAVPPEDTAKMLWFASRAPSGSNVQPFRFLVLGRSPEAAPVRQVLARIFRDRWAAQGPTYGYEQAAPGSRAARMGATMERFVTTAADAPLIVFVCAEAEPGHEWTLTDGASVYPAVQNLLLAARGLGYGGVVSLWHRYSEAEVRDMLGMPDDARIFATIVLGRPEGGHGPVRRAPLSELVYEDRWGRSPSWAVDPPGTRFSGGARH
jgi:nitroreductase